MTRRWNMREWWSKVRSIARRRESESELREELQSHLRLLEEEFLTAGLLPEEARAAAMRKFGNPVSLREQAREAWAFPRVETFLQDLRSGVRNIRHSPGSSLLIIVTLALGIGANTAMFSVVAAVLFMPPPYPGGERLTEVREVTASQKIPVTWNNLQRWRTENHTFADMAGFETVDLTLTGHGDALLTHAGVVSEGFFHLTGWRPEAGRLLNQGDDQPGATPVVLVSSEFWMRVLNGDPHAIGSALALDGRNCEVVGILPPGLKFFETSIDFYLPEGPRDGSVGNRAEHDRMVVLGLLKPHVTIAAAREDLDAVMRRHALSGDVAEREHHSAVDLFAHEGTAAIRPMLLMLMGAVGLVLAIACANVAGLLLVRNSSRTRELAIRSAIGAGRRRIARQLLTEYLVLELCGGSAGLLLAAVCLGILVKEGPRDIPRLWNAQLNWPVLLFAGGLTLVTGIMAGLAHVWTADKLDLTTALKEGSAGAGAGRKGQGIRDRLVVAEIAVTLVLCFACAVLTRSLEAAQTAYPGFQTFRVLALELRLPPSRYTSDEAVRRFYERLVDAIHREPGVVSIGMVNCPPSTGGCAKGWYSVEDLPKPSLGAVPLALLTTVDSGYFRTLGVRLIAGRDFRPRDNRSAPTVVVINEKLARHWWPAAPQLAVGHPLKLGGPYLEGPTYEIAGVVSDVRQTSLDEAPSEEIYVAFAQSPSQEMVVMVRTAGDPSRWISTVRRDLAGVDENVAIQSVRPFADWMSATLERRGFSTLLVGLFAGLAVLLSAVGIFGLLDSWVSARKQEIAIRVALGAQRAEVVRWAGLYALRLVVSGIVLGLAGVWFAARMLESLVFGVPAYSPAAIVSSVAALVGVAVVASCFPLWRAARVEAAMHHLRDV